ncbi:alpha/beta hydrolase [Streptomyces sp. CAU 1734]|uniref:alpha/beta hydrolase n=1 Tax=Streptomyces sp. CAU 1734 TaxID=3140360 RepID=UPI00325FE91C
MQVRRLATALVVSMIATLAPALGGPSAAAAPAADGQERKLSWKGCAPELPAGLECATVTVPQDYRNPGAGTIGMAISRLAATDPAKRRGALLINPGGPGAWGLDMPVYLQEAFPASVRERYDLIGFDPRGVGSSAPITCGLSPEELDGERAWTPAAFPRHTAVTRSIADKCRDKYGEETLSRFNTRNTARDMDRIRAALGERKISFLGYSYGTYLGAVYTQMFPRRVDRFILDSAIDPATAWRHSFRVWGSEAERAFKRWTEWTAARSASYGLGDTPAEVSRTFWDIIARADREPIRLGDTPFSGAQLRAMTRTRIFKLRSGAEWVVELKRAAAGETVPAPLPPYLWDDNATAMFWTVVCGDTAWSRNPETYRREAARDAVRHPLYGDYSGNIAPCAFWGENAEPATRVANGVPALILQNEWDSQTPLSNARGLRRALDGSRLVTVDEGEGHGVYGTFVSDCAERIANTYLVTGVLPAGDRVCEPNPAAAQRARAGSRVPVPIR